MGGVLRAGVRLVIPLILAALVLCDNLPSRSEQAAGRRPPSLHLNNTDFKWPPQLTTNSPQTRWWR